MGGLNKSIETKVEVVSPSTMEGVREAYTWISEEPEVFSLLEKINSQKREEVDMSDVERLVGMLEDMAEDSALTASEGPVPENYLRMLAKNIKREYKLDAAKKGAE